MGYDLAWNQTLAAMRDYGPRLQLQGRCGTCNTWPAVNLEDYARAYGWGFSFWDWEEPCPTCGEDLTFLCSPGPTTPLLPMRTEAGRVRAIARGAAKATQALLDKGWTRVDGRWIRPTATPADERTPLPPAPFRSSSAADSAAPEPRQRPAPPSAENEEKPRRRTGGASTPHGAGVSIRSD